MKRGKQAYYDKYFETNCNNVQNTWKGIKYLISPKTVCNVPTVISLDNVEIINSPYDITNTHSNYFVSMAETKKKHKILTKTFLRLYFKWKW